MDIQELKRNFEQFLKQRGYKVTKSRLNLVDKIASYGSHFEIEQLVHYVVGSSKDGVSRSTVYRTVKLLQEFGAIREVIKLGNRTIYEFSAGKPHHEHLVCVECGKIIEFYKDEIEELQDKVCQEMDFTPLHHRLEIFGICSECRSSHENRR